VTDGQTDKQPVDITAVCIASNAARCKMLKTKKTLVEGNYFTLSKQVKSEITLVALYDMMADMCPCKCRAMYRELTMLLSSNSRKTNCWCRCWCWCCCWCWCYSRLIRWCSTAWILSLNSSMLSGCYLSEPRSCFRLDVDVADDGDNLWRHASRICKHIPQRQRCCWHY